MKKILIIFSLLCTFAQTTDLYAKKSPKKNTEQAGSLIALGLNQLACSLQESNIVLSDVTEEEIAQYLNSLPAEFLTRARATASAEEFTATFVATAKRAAALFDQALKNRQRTDAKKITRSCCVNPSLLLKHFEPLMHKTAAWVTAHKVVFIVAITFIIINLHTF